ncbi:helix-turn-helix domain-containing protein [Hominifimenecus sp. rT4P-3]|uniref:helix-turn-helix domain-containing protein n=1 Tax=Hominifimenecus sp. rT4P-3 TaxID=3242979 RepID=UPI003DA416C9
MNTGFLNTIVFGETDMNYPNDTQDLNLSKKGNIPFENVDYYLDLFAHIKYYRQKAGITQEELANRTGLSRPFISSLESKKEPRGLSMESFFLICHALNVPPVKFFEPLP